MSQLSFAQCYDVSLSNGSFSPSNPAIVGDETVLTFSFCNDNDELPLDETNMVDIVISPAKMNPVNTTPQGIEQAENYFDITYLEDFNSRSLNQNKNFPPNECISLTTSFLVTAESNETNPSAGVNMNIAPSVIINGSSCNEPEDDNLNIFTSAIILVNTNDLDKELVVNIFPNPIHYSMLQIDQNQNQNEGH